MLKEPVRLVCPDCDTVHRVRSVTLGKVYRCKKCGAGLVTLAPAVLTCPKCGAKSEPAHVDISRVTTCTNCPDAPLLTVTFPADTKPASTQEAQAHLQIDPEKIGEIIRRSLQETVGNTVEMNVRKTVQEVVQNIIRREFAALNVAAVSEKHPADLDVEARQREKQLVQEFHQEFARLLAVRMGEFSRLLHEHEEEQRANLHQIIKSELTERVSSLAAIIEEIQDQKTGALREELEQGLNLHLAEAKAGRAEVAQLAQDLQDKVREPLANMARESEERGKQLATQLQADLSAFAKEQAETIQELVTTGSDRLAAKFTDRISTDLEKLSVDYHKQATLLRESLTQNLKTEVIAELATLTTQNLEELEQNLSKTQAAAESRLQQAIADQIQSAMLAQAEKLSTLNSQRESEIAQRVQQELDRVLASVPDGESLSEIRVDQLVTESMERVLGEHLEKMQHQSKQLNHELREFFRQVATQNSQALIQNLESSLLSRLEQLTAGKADDTTTIRESLHQAEERIINTFREMLSTDIPAAMVDVTAKSEEAAEAHTHRIVEQVAGKFTDQIENLEHAIQEADHGPSTAEVQTAITNAFGKLKTDLEASISKVLSETIQHETRSALEGAVGDLPQIMDAKVVMPLEQSLSEKIPQVLGQLQEEELTKTFSNAARESKQAITAEVRQAAGATITWISWVAVPLILILFAPLAFIAWQVRSLSNTATAPAATISEQALDTRLQQIQEQVSLLGARQNAKTLKLEHDFAVIQKLRQDLIQQNTVLERDNQALKKSLADYKQAIEKWRINADKWQKLAQDNYSQVQELKRKLQQLGVSSKTHPVSKPRNPKKATVPKWP